MNNMGKIKENRIKSDYYYNATIYYDEYQKKICESWGVLINSKYDSYQIIDTGNLSFYEMDEEAKVFFNSHLVKEVIFITKKHIEKIKKQLNISAIFQIGLDGANRILVKEKNIAAKKRIIIYTIQYFDKNGNITIESDSFKYQEFNINDIKKIFKRCEKKLLNLRNYRWIFSRKEIKSIVCSPTISAMITHELFGHLFERDNFEKVREFKISDNISIYDSPKKGLSGDCIFDDYGNMLQESLIIQNGEVKNLIGDRENDIHRFRAGNKKVLCRVTNTIICPKKIDNIEKYDDILWVENIKQVAIKGEILIIKIDGSYMNGDKGMLKIPEFVLKIPVYEVLANIQCIQGPIGKISSVYCIKQNQRCGGIGSISPVLKLNLENSYYIG